MKTETIQANDAQEKLANLKFSDAKIFEYACDIKGDPIANINGDNINFSIIFPSKTTLDKVSIYTERIVRAVNLLSYMESALKDKGVYSSSELSLLKELLEAGYESTPRDLIGDADK